MPTLRDVDNDYVERFAALDPCAATSWGLPGHETELTDFSPDGIEARAQLSRDTLTALAGLRPADERERIAIDVMCERLQTQRAADEAGDPYRDVSNIVSPVQSIRESFDLMAHTSIEDWETIAIRMSAVPDALEGVRLSLREGAQRGVRAARRQAMVCAEQTTRWSGDGGRGYFDAMVDGCPSDVAGGPLASRLRDAAAAAQAAYATTARFFRDEYAPGAPEADAVGPERYARGARSSLGDDVDLAETYAWGWEELARIERRMEEVAREVDPHRSLNEVVSLLETDPTSAIDGVEPFRQWLQRTMDDAITALAGTHFDIPAPLRTVEAMIAPPGGAAAMYYTPPSEDFSRPGRTWYPARDLTRFPLWKEVSTAYHEGVPGHHLQDGGLKCLGDQLTRYQRSLAFISGHGEGWALYAERLMEELGLFEKPDYVLGMLSAQAFRAVRVIVDIGMHLELELPHDQPFHPGERWTPALGLDFGMRRARLDRGFMQSEIERYLGWPGQAISYKVGERVWLDVREAARRRDGADFDLKTWHTHALGLGPMGLRQLRKELTVG